MAGGTASGKTTISHRVSKALGVNECLSIAHDRYYFDVPDPSLHNYDHPDALDTDLLCAHLALLKAGRSAPLPIYDFASHERQKEVALEDPRPVVLVEGILVLAVPSLRSLIDLAVYVDAPEEVRLERRIVRDMASRGRTRDDVLRQYSETVSPMHERFVAPSRASVDLEVSGVGDPEVAVREVLAAVRARQTLLQGVAPSSGRD